MSYGYVYVAQVAMGANAAQTLKAIQEAEAYHGPSLIIGYAPCEMHSIKGGMQNCQKEMKKAVDCGYWNMFRFNPAAEKKFTLDSKAPAGGYQEFLMNEARYSRLTREFPDRASELFAKNEAEAQARYEHLSKLAALYDWRTPRSVTSTCSSWSTCTTNKQNSRKKGSTAKAGPHKKTMKKVRRRLPADFFAQRRRQMIFRS